MIFHSYVTNYQRVNVCLTLVCLEFWELYGTVRLVALPSASSSRLGHQMAKVRKNVIKFPFNFHKLPINFPDFIPMKFTMP